MIPIQNIYYMLSYSFTELNKKGYEKLEVEEFDNILELLSEILILGLTKQIKRGIDKNYQNKEEFLSTIRGKVDITHSMESFINHRKLLCQYDEFTVNSYKNRIIKTTIHYILRNDLSKNRKKKIKRLLAYFNEVDFLDIHKINWNMEYNRNNQTYLMLINICYLIITGLLQSNKKGKYNLISLTEDNMPRLYEKFILEYYRQEHPELKAESPQIKWQLDNDFDYLLPVMQTDITLSQQNNILIIDAKYYKHTLQERYETKSIHSNNLYQIFTYVKNKEAELKENKHEVNGMLLYAKTDEKEYPEYTYNMSGNRISARTLDLNVDFQEIRKQLDDIVEEYF